MTIESILKESTLVLRDAGLEQPRFEAEVLLAECIKASRAMLYAHGRHELDGEIAEDFKNKLARRAGHEPMAYILGKKEFMGLTFTISPSVLIPRPDTEILVVEALARIPQNVERFSVLDLCTGSGAIGLSLAHYCPNISLTLSDISEDVLNIAAINAKKICPSAHLVKGNLFEPLAGEKFDLIVSNPPYIPKKVIETLEPDVKDYEPRLALDGGESGFDLYDPIIAEARRYLSYRGWLLLEAGDGQGEKLLEKMTAAGFQNPFMAQDLMKMPRCIGGQNA